jgi:hypothetical protein
MVEAYLNNCANTYLFVNGWDLRLPNGQDTLQEVEQFTCLAAGMVNRILQTFGPMILPPINGRLFQQTQKKMVALHPGT